MHVIAKEEVELKRLGEQIAVTEARLAKEKEQILRLKTDLASGKGPSSTATGLHRRRGKGRPGRRFERYKTGEATLASLKGICQAREHGLDAARQRLDGMLAARRQLEVDVENLGARNQMVAAAQATSNFQFDESQLVARRNWSRTSAPASTWPSAWSMPRRSTKARFPGQAHAEEHRRADQPVFQPAGAGRYERGGEIGEVLRWCRCQMCRVGRAQRAHQKPALS